MEESSWLKPWNWGWGSVNGWFNSCTGALQGCLCSFQYRYLEFLQEL